MATQTAPRFPADQRNGHTQPVLDNRTTPEHAASMLGRGAVDKDTVVEWACSFSIPIPELFPLLAMLSGEDFKTIAAAQEKFRAKQPAGGAFSMKVSEKGAVSLRGVPGCNIRFGLTLYAEALEFLFSHREQIERFIADNHGKLSRKQR